MELCLVFYDSLDGRGVWGRMDTCLCMTESLCYSAETTTTLLIGASLVAQLVKNPPAMQETPVRLLGREDSLEIK